MQPLATIKNINNKYRNKDNVLDEVVALFSKGNFADEMATNTVVLPGSIVVPNIELFEYPGIQDPTNIVDVMDIDISCLITSEALISFPLLS